MSSNNETALGTAEANLGKSKIKLACGRSVPFIRQVAKKMCNFSTRYVPPDDNRDLSRMLGKLPFNANVNALFGFPTTIDPGFYIPKTHGPWWDQAPSGSRPDFMPQNKDLNVGHDFVDFSFEREVYPIRVCIFEAFNPGCVIKIWAENFETKLWHKLWSGSIEYCSATHRIFCPSLEPCTFKTKLLRFELSHCHLKYYTQLEGAFLMGSSEFVVPVEKCQNPKISALYHNIRGPKNHEEFAENNRSNVQALEEDLANVKKTMKTYWTWNGSANKNKVSNVKAVTSKAESKAESSNETASVNDNPEVFDILPAVFDFTSLKKTQTQVRILLKTEALLRILKALDLRSLCRCSQVNRRFNSMARDALLYSSLNLKPYWHIIDATALKYLTPRCEYLRRLDMSWCGNYGDTMIQPEDMGKFIEDCGQLLTNLRLNCCQFVTDGVVKKISSCTGLTELCLNNCQNISDVGFMHLETLDSLERLELYRAKITTATLCAMIHHNPQMRHLNLAETPELEMDDVVKKIVDYCPNLESIDCWYSRSLTSDGLKMLSKCTNLREIDIGWCPQIYNINAPPEDAMRTLLSACTSLEKIGLTAQSFIKNQDLEPLLSNQRLRQLHLGGNAYVTLDFLDKLLTKCPEMRMIDLNCYQGIKSSILLLREAHPGVSIKWSSYPTYD